VQINQNYLFLRQLTFPHLQCNLLCWFQRYHHLCRLVNVWWSSKHHSIQFIIPFGKNCHITIWFALLNSTVILFVIPSVYTKGLFLSVYLWMNFTIRFIPLIKRLIKITCHRTFVAFLFFLFPLQFPWYILIKYFR